MAIGKHGHIAGFSDAEALRAAHDRFWTTGGWGRCPRPDRAPPEFRGKMKELGGV
ncbi:MAG: hypothetical protein AAF755_11290 [Pseudomonadota bacterium]